MSEEWMSTSTVQVAPDAKFRQDLQRALEQTHRQQLVQRQLGRALPPAASPSDAKLGSPRHCCC